MRFNFYVIYFFMLFRNFLFRSEDFLDEDDMNVKKNESDESDEEEDFSLNTKQSVSKPIFKKKKGVNVIFISSIVIVSGTVLFIVFSGKKDEEFSLKNVTAGIENWQKLTNSAEGAHQIKIEQNLLFFKESEAKRQAKEKEIERLEKESDDIIAKLKSANLEKFKEIEEMQKEITDMKDSFKTEAKKVIKEIKESIKQEISVISTIDKITGSHETEKEKYKKFFEKDQQIVGFQQDIRKILLKKNQETEKKLQKIFPEYTKKTNDLWGRIKALLETNRDGDFTNDQILLLNQWQEKTDAILAIDNDILNSIKDLQFFLDVNDPQIIFNLFNNKSLFDTVNFKKQIGSVASSGALMGYDKFFTYDFPEIEIKVGEDQSIPFTQLIEENKKIVISLYKKLKINEADTKDLRKNLEFLKEESKKLINDEAKSSQNNLSQYQKEEKEKMEKIQEIGYNINVINTVLREYARKHQEIQRNINKLEHDKKDATNNLAEVLEKQKKSANNEKENIEKDIQSKEKIITDIQKVIDEIDELSKRNNTNKEEQTKRIKELLENLDKEETILNFDDDDAEFLETKQKIVKKVQNKAKRDKEINIKNTELVDDFIDHQIKELTNHKKTKEAYVAQLKLNIDNLKKGKESLNKIIQSQNKEDFSACIDDMIKDRQKYEEKIKKIFEDTMLKEITIKELAHSDIKTFSDKITEIMAKAQELKKQLVEEIEKVHVQMTNIEGHIEKIHASPKFIQIEENIRLINEILLKESENNELEVVLKDVQKYNNNQTLINDNKENLNKKIKALSEERKKEKERIKSEKNLNIEESKKLTEEINKYIEQLNDIKNKEIKFSEILKTENGENL